MNRMSQLAFLAAFFLLAGPTPARAACYGFATPKTAAPKCNYWKCTVDGWFAWPYPANTPCSAQGTSGVCDGGQVVAGLPEPEEVGLCSIDMRVPGHYAIAGVWYTAPGNQSSVTYSQQSQTGTSVSTTSGSGNSYSVSVSNEAKFLGLIGGAYDVTYTHAWSGSSTTKVDSLITYSTGNSIPGPGGDYLDHNYDQVVLLLGPDIVFTGHFYNATTLNKLTWALDSSRAILYPVQVGWLNGAWGPMPQNIASTLFEYGGITSADFAQILGATPFANDPAGQGALDPARFECVEQLYYIPGQPNIEAFGISNAYSSSNTNTTSHQYSVRLAIAGTWLHQSLKGSDTWTWSHSSSATNTSTSQSTEQVSLHQPSTGYSGSTLVFVYVDKVYKTLLFSFVPPPVPTARCQ